ncbi:MAG TPA: transglutaminase domain-containing protein [Terriglobales bacterium]|jgi:transglutaminase-like putative cysteine protease|nr:transglutaminase domain-containing protein [Terriglobales bacterium]
MKRREFLRHTGSMCAGLALSKAVPLFADTPASGGWRTFEVTTHVEVLKPSGVTHIWVPAALIRNTSFQKTLGNKFVAPGGTARLTGARQDSLGIVTATYPERVKPALTLTSRVSVRNYGVDLSTPFHETHASRSELEYCLRPSKYIPTDGIVKATADKAVKGAGTDFEKARAIYEWIVENTFRDPKVRGCGRGDIRFMLESGDLGGKCADLNALYVGLARAAGLPARDVYGLRINKSDLGYKSLGLATDKATKAQHCRAEVYLNQHGWVPVDPADVRKVVLEEPPGNLKLDDAMVSKARTRLFGSWEMNWMGYNYAHDVALPGSTGQSLVYFMYPQAETAEGRVDPFDPDNFRYEITAKEVT